MSLFFRKIVGADADGALISPRYGPSGLGMGSLEEEVSGEKSPRAT